MKTCLLYSGQTRSFAQIWENHRWYLKWAQPDIFASVADDEQAPDMELVKKSFPKSHVLIERVKQEPIAEPEELTRFRSGYPRSTTLQGVLRQLKALERTWEFFTNHARYEDYDVVIRARPDIAFVRCDLPRPLSHLGAWTCWCPWWARWGGVNDRFAVLGPQAAKAYFTTFGFREQLWDFGCPRHPEQMIHASLYAQGVAIDDACAFEFVAVRMPSKEHPNGGYFPVDASSIDVADYARKRG